MMRVALIGDLQYAQGEEPKIFNYLEQIREQKPDMAVFMGDMGCNGQLGSLEGMLAVSKMLTRLECPVAALMGNHDVEYRPDDVQLRSPEHWYTECFGRKQPWQAIETEEALLLCVSVERQPEKTYLTQHALFVSEEQFSWLETQLKEHSHKPTILLTHAPMAGSGVRCCPPIHSAATDAHLDHSFQAMRWKRLAQKNPQLRAWCSAHFHMGHNYPSALTWAERVLHISCGVLTSAARDGTRQTRFLELQGDGRLNVLTLDHLRPKILHQDTMLEMTGERRAPREAVIRNKKEIFLGEDKALLVFTLPERKKLFLTTTKGKLWEYDCELDELLGALRLNKTVKQMAYLDERVFWEETNGSVFSVSARERARFERLSGYYPQKIRQEKTVPMQKMRQISFIQRHTQEGWYVLVEGKN